MTGALIAAPILLPAFAGAASLLFRRRRQWVGAAISVGSTAGLVGLAIWLMTQAAQPVAYALGNWPAPFGIVLVLDRLAALMLLLTGVLALAISCHGVLTGLARRGWHFHPLFQFLLLGVNGAFLTGDLFNLFVFFEVLLIASYGLMLHGQGARRLTAGVQYVIVNLIGSTIFLMGLGLLYGATGTLNMADMAERAAALPVGDRGLMQAGGLLLVAVFALKAALLPLHLWLPRTYASSAPAVAALFAILTKVGVYAIIRTVPLIFGGVAGTFLLPAALGTMLLGFAGLLAPRRLRDMAAFGLIGSTATLMLGVALLDRQGMAAALYYLPHTTLTVALLFLTIDLLIRWRGTEGDAIVPTPPFAGQGMLALLFMAAAVALAGLPPLAGFIGKLLILKAALASPYVTAIWAVVLGTSLIAIIALARAGSRIFWEPCDGVQTGRKLPRHREALPAFFLLGLLAALTVAAGPVTAYMDATASQIFDTDSYIRTVLTP